MWVFWRVILLVSIVLSADLETHKKKKRIKLAFWCHIVDGRIVLEHLQQCSYVIMHSTIGWRKIKTCQFGSRKWFWLSIIAEFAVPTKSWQQQCRVQTCKKECNKYDLTASQCFSLVYHNDWSKWFAVSSPPHISLLSHFQCYGWGCKR